MQFRRTAVRQILKGDWPVQCPSPFHTAAADPLFPRTELIPVDGVKRIGRRSEWRPAYTMGRVVRLVASSIAGSCVPLGLCRLNGGAEFVLLVPGNLNHFRRQLSNGIQ